VNNSGFSYAPVPLPAAFWLFASALGFFGLSKRRTQNRLAQ
jgi:hypothetical protein